MNFNEPKNLYPAAIENQEQGDNMETKHTPGPWTYQRRRSDEYLIKEKGGAGYIATVYAAMVGDGPFEANARLIASAPALTSALDACMQALTPIASWMLKAEMSGIGPDHTDKDRLLDTAITLARAALDAAKKARG